MRKFILASLALFLFIPSVLAEDFEVTSYQKLKNITKNDHPAGSNLTMGFSGDEIRFLIFIQNKTDEKAAFRIEDILPEKLTYQANTTSRYQLGSGGAWQEIQDKDSETLFPLQDYIISIEPGVGFYFKFSTVVADDIPENNLTLSNFVNIYDSANKVVKQTVTKVLIPNSTIKQVETTTVTVDEEDYLNQVLEEEQKFIEETFFELEARGFDGILPETKILDLNDDQESEKNQNENISTSSNKIVVYTLIVILLIPFLLYLKYKFKGNDQNKPKF